MFPTPSDPTALLNWKWIERNIHLAFSECYSDMKKHQFKVLCFFFKFWKATCDDTFLADVFQSRKHLDVRGLTQKGLPTMNPFRGRSKADPGVRVPSSGDSLMIYKWSIDDLKMMWRILRLGIFVPFFSAPSYWSFGSLFDFLRWLALPLPSQKWLSPASNAHPMIILTT